MKTMMTQKSHMVNILEHYGLSVKSVEMRLLVEYNRKNIMNDFEYWDHEEEELIQEHYEPDEIGLIAALM